ncbi:helix-turn-helix domain-containing protein [Lentzea pudingi]|nr:helix-turn-helix domain-containing protein [Lentzea pudingi]
MTTRSRPEPAPSTPGSGRRETPLTGPADCPKRLFAEALRALRDSTGRPPYTELARRVPASESALSKTASGRKQPTLEMVRTYVVACRGDVEHFERLYLGLFGSAR